MDCHGMIVQLLQVGCQGRRLLLHILLVSHTALGQEADGIAGEEFELRIGSISTQHGNIQITGSGILRALLQAVNKWHIVLVGGEITSHRQIGKSLIHDHNDIRTLHALRVFHSCCKPSRILPGLLIIAAGAICRIICGLLHIQIFHFHQKCHDIAISLIHDGGGKQLII